MNFKRKYKTVGAFLNHADTKSSISNMIATPERPSWGTAPPGRPPPPGGSGGDSGSTPGGHWPAARNGSTIRSTAETNRSQKPIEGAPEWSTR